nr:hypothetical protein HAGR004_16210 [Bdellovibrio sp. HAGR004]
MKFALVNTEKKEAEKGLVGVCTGCGQPMIPVCGIKRINHWRHKVDCECDHWWENETEWHRSWKNNFPKENQEIRHKDDASGEWHIADVKTKHGYILEFQHSFLKPEERQSRNNFYSDKLVWVVDGLKRQKDKAQFDLFLKYAMPINQNSPLLKLHSFIDESPLLKEWSECSVPVFFDFGQDLPLWCLLPKSSKGNFYVLEYSRHNFILLHTESLNGNTFSDLMAFLYTNMFAHENPEIIEAAKRIQYQPTPPPVARKELVVYPRVSLDNLRWLERQMSPPSQRFQYKSRRPKRR